VFFVDGSGQLCLRIKYDTGYHEILPWYDEGQGVWYYFLPGNIQGGRAWCGELKGSDFLVDGIRVSGYLDYLSGEDYEISFGQEKRKVVFLETTGVSTLFLDTESGSMEHIHEDKGNWEKGSVLSIDAKGNVFFNGRADKIVGRGNATWVHDKKPYHIKLASPGGLAGLEEGTKWNLLAFFFDGDKIHTKLGLDIAGVLGQSCAPDSTWVNLYTNGEYRGLYLLTETVVGQDVFGKEQDVLLLEKDIVGRYEELPHYVTKNGNPLVIVRPEAPSAGELEGIAGYIQEVEDRINSGDFISAIDMDSFAIQLLAEEISLNYDAFRASSYVYRPAGEEKLYAGPAWDYDGAFGEYAHRGEAWADPGSTVLNQGDNQLDWYGRLYSNQEFYGCLVGKFEEKLPELEELLTAGIEEYAALIRDSALNDDIRWNWTSGTLYRAGIYQTWENDVRYLRYFCAERLQALCRRFGITAPDSEWAGEDAVHRVTFRAGEDLLLSLEVKDGETVDIGELDVPEGFRGGRWLFSYSGEEFYHCLPILEDCELIYEANE